MKAVCLASWINFDQLCIICFCFHQHELKLSLCLTFIQTGVVVIIQFLLARLLLKIVYCMQVVQWVMKWILKNYFPFVQRYCFYTRKGFLMSAIIFSCFTFSTHSFFLQWIRSLFLSFTDTKRQKILLKSKAAHKFETNVAQYHSSSHSKIFYKFDIFLFQQKQKDLLFIKGPLIGTVFSFYSNIAI